MRILYLIPSMQPSGARGQLAMLAQGMRHAGDEVAVCQFHEDPGPREIPVHSLGWERAIDPVPLWRLHKFLGDFRPDLIHLWHTSALRILALVGPRYLSRVVLSQPFTWHERTRLAALDRWLLRTVARIVVHSDVEARLGRDAGIILDKIAVIAPGAAENAVTNPLPAEWGTWPRKIVCVGPLSRHKGFRDAIWTFDMLRFVFDDIHLVLIGDGPDRPALEKMARDLECAHVTHFVGEQASVAPYLGQADLCWIPSRRGGGTQAALEAMLAGRPVIACDAPNLHGLIADGDSGFVVAPGDKVTLARRTRQILLDPSLAHRLGTSARARAVNHFSAPRFVEHCRQTYLQVA